MAFYSILSSYAFPTFAVSLGLLSCWKMRPLSLRWPISRWYCRWNKQRIQVRFIKAGLTSFDYDWHADTSGCLHSFRNLPKQSWLLAMVLLPGCRPGFSQKRCLVCECFFSLGISQLLLINDPLRLRVMVSFFCIWCQMEKMVYRFTMRQKTNKKPQTTRNNVSLPACFKRKIRTDYVFITTVFQPGEESYLRHASLTY